MLDRTEGAVAFLHKPFLPEDLTGALRQVSRTPRPDPTGHKTCKPLPPGASPAAHRVERGTPRWTG